MVLHSQDLFSPLTSKPSASTHQANNPHKLAVFVIPSVRNSETKQIVHGKTYPIKIIFQALCLYNLGHTYSQVYSRLKSRFGLNIKRPTLSSWVNEFKEPCAYNRLGSKRSKLFSSSQILYTLTLYPQQVYRYSYHRAKLQLLLEQSTRRHFKPLKKYLENIATDCSHKLFQSQTRSSSTKASFSLNNDSAMVATEVPVYLLPEDVHRMQKKLKFVLPFKLEEPLTGHIDFVQVLNKVIHLLDYKPKADKERKALAQ